MKTLLVASTGGHLAELHHLSERFASSDRLWVTFDSPQSRSLLQHEQVLWAPPTTSRDLVGTAKNVSLARDVFRTTYFDHVVSTGAAIAFAFLPLAHRRGIESHYIESATRLHGPSLTGKLVAATRGVHLYTQHQPWSDKRWRFAGSVFDDFRALPRPTKTVKKLVVSLGTHRKYDFSRAIRRLASIIPPDVDVLWQAGISNVDGLDLALRDTVPTNELEMAIAEADAVVTHAGVGSALTALKAQKMPVYLPRRHAFREHVDDHQAALAEQLSGRGLALWREADQVEWNDIVGATGWRVERTMLDYDFDLSTTIDLRTRDLRGVKPGPTDSLPRPSSH